MSSKQLVEVPGLGDSSKYAYSQCATANGFVFVAGQTGVDENYRPVSDDFEPQARQALENVRLALDAAGSSFDDIVNMTVYLTDMRYGHDFLEIRKEVLGDTLAPSALIGGIQLAFPSLLVEVQVMAVQTTA